MMEDMSVEMIAILLAAGRGSRLGGGGNKVFHKIGGITILERAARCLFNHPAVSSMIVVVSPSERDRIGSLLAGSFTGHRFCVVSGGETRQASALLGLRAAGEMADEAGSGRVIALIHDAARCFLPVETITGLLDTIGRFHCGAAPAVPVKDTIRFMDETGRSIVRTMPRERLLATQTPQGADLDLLLNAAELAEKENVKVTDDLELLIRIGFPVRLIKGDPLNIKITTPEDILFAEACCIT
ncbi:MAG: 2-C-methyl-D-erythritol 4-phosphate cytidylyltransferase [Clostridiaceae bacterium]|nr:2-C-methyl-D-erythritol 4-phosphate cytidylyltransferase [Clostridiaceae bacterium]